MILSQLEKAIVNKLSYQFKKVSDIYKQPIHPDEQLDRNYVTCNFYLKDENAQTK